MYYSDDKPKFVDVGISDQFKGCPYSRLHCSLFVAEISPCVKENTSWRLPNIQTLHVHAGESLYSLVACKTAFRTSEVPSADIDVRFHKFQTRRLHVDVAAYM